jgi:hypothetical protein
MPLRLPIALDAEFRGVKPPREYTIRETGERKLASAVLKFELERENGDVELIEVAGSTFDRMTPAVDYGSFQRGQRFALRGTAVIQDRGSDYDSYLAVESCEPVGKAAIRAAA